MSDKSEKKYKKPVHIRWMIPQDYPEVLQIEKDSFEFPWNEDDFRKCFRQRNCIGRVAKHEGKVIGFMIYELHKTRIHVLSFAVDPKYRHEGVGTQMMDELIKKLSAERRSRLVLEIRETNIDVQLFFKAMGFRAVNSLKNFYEDAPGENAYVMHYKYKQPAQSLPEQSSAKVAEKTASRGSNDYKSRRTPPTDIAVAEEDIARHAQEQLGARSHRLKSMQAGLEALTDCKWEILQITAAGEYKPLKKPLEEMPYDASAKFFLGTVQPVDNYAEKYQALMKEVGIGNPPLPRHVKFSNNMAEKIIIDASFISKKRLDDALEKRDNLHFGAPDSRNKGERILNERDRNNEDGMGLA